ncbi:hypothetical protein BaRGS_00037739 [Batillaria attramentaria]|uniref:Uncharacterized protein n=1 Tax=Batillaria attramentaria TaxID=370345 RepID=A0ABD0J8L3_9CAEN
MDVRDQLLPARTTKDNYMEQKIISEKFLPVLIIQKMVVSSKPTRLSRVCIVLAVVTGGCVVPRVESYHWSVYRSGYKDIDIACSACQWVYIWDVQVSQRQTAHAATRGRNADKVVSVGLSPDCQ